MSNNQKLIKRLPGTDSDIGALLLGIGAILNDVEKSSRVYEKISRVNPDLQAVKDFRQSLFNTLSVLSVLGKA